MDWTLSAILQLKIKQKHAFINSKVVHLILALNLIIKIEFGPVTEHLKKYKIIHGLEIVRPTKLKSIPAKAELHHMTK